MWGSPRGELEMGNWGVEKEEEYIKDALCHGPTMGPRKEEKTPSASWGLLCSHGIELRLVFINAVIHLCCGLNRFS